MFLDALPDEILRKILVFTDPLWAVPLYNSSTLFRKMLNEFYRHNASSLFSVGGEWRHCIKSKRTLASISTNQLLSPTPKGIASILHQQCAVCNKPLVASIQNEFGLLAHPCCIRPYLVNLYEFEQLGLLEHHFQNQIPTFSWNGLRGNYSYTTVWKDRCDALVPYEWTAHSFIHSKTK